MTALPVRGLRLLSFWMLLVCSGCLPVRLQDTPHLSGVVLSNATKEPIAAAKLHFAKYPRRVCWTSSAGRFDFPPLYHWHIMPLAPFDRFDPEELIVEAANYMTAGFDFSHWQEETGKIIYLKSAGESN